MNFHVLTLFPEMIRQGSGTSITGRAMEQGTISVNAIDIRDYTTDKHRKVDDYPYGGGAGMLMQAQPVYDCFQAVKGTIPNSSKLRCIYVTPQGRTFTQQDAEEFAREEDLVILCGHYEGIDERVLEEIVTDYISIGDFVLTGGELPAMVMIDAISRLVPGVLHNDLSAEVESFHCNLLEFPQYSRPECWHGKSVPEVLLSGNHKKIEAWRKEQSVQRTKERRPDLYEQYEIEQKCLERLGKDKVLHIDMIEALRRGNGRLLFSNKEGAFLWEKKSDSYLISAVSAQAGKRMLEKVAPIVAAKNQVLHAGEPGQSVDFGKKAVWVHQAEVRECLREQYGLSVMGTYRQTVYTRNVTLPVTKQIEIRELDKTSGQESQIVYGAYVEGMLAGTVKIMSDGNLDSLQVAESFRRQGIGTALLSVAVNRILELGWLPVGRIGCEQKEALGLVEKLGFRLSKTDLWLMK